MQSAHLLRSDPALQTTRAQSLPAVVARRTVHMDVFPDNPMLAQSYVPIQFMNETFKPCVGLKHGTIFPELVSPYKPCDSMRQIDFIEKTNSIGEGCNK